jgi:hypothetical protein
MITNIDKFSNLRFITSSLNPLELIGKVLKDAQNSIIINTYGGHIGIFVCDGVGNIQRATAEFSNDFNIDGNVASISGAVNELKQQIKDLRDAFNKLSENGGNVHVPLITNPPLPKPVDVNLSTSNVVILGDEVAKVTITVRYDKNIRFDSDVITPSIHKKHSDIRTGLKLENRGSNTCQYTLTISKGDATVSNNTITVNVGDLHARLDVTVTRQNDVLAKITRLRVTPDKIVFNNDNQSAIIKVHKDLSAGTQNINQLKTEIISSSGITISKVEYSEQVDKYYVSASGGGGTVVFGVADRNWNPGVDNTSISITDNRTVVTPSVVPTPPTPKALRRISKVIVEGNTGIANSVQFKAGTVKTFKYTADYVGEQEDDYTNNIYIASKDGITVEVDKKTKTITFTTPRTLSAKSDVIFDVMSNNKVVGTIHVNVTALEIQRISSVRVNNGEPISITAGTDKKVSYEIVSYNGELPDNDTNNIEIASKDNINVTVNTKEKTITFHTERTLSAKQVDFDITSNNKVVDTIHVNVKALPLRRITKITVNTTNSVQFKAGTDTTVNYTVTYNGSPEDTISDNNTDNIEIASTPDVMVGINPVGKQIMFSTESNLGKKSVDFTVTSNGEIVGTVHVDVTAQEPRRISEVRVNDNKPVSITAGTDKKVSYDIIAYKGELPDNNTDNIEVVSPDSSITVKVDKTNKSITFTTPRTLSSQSHTFNVTCNGNKVGTVNVNITALPIRRITNVSVNGGRPVSLAAGDGTTVDYTVAYNGSSENTNSDNNTDNIEIVSKDNINVILDPRRKKITFRLSLDVISAKSVSFDIMSNGTKVGEVNVVLRYNIVLKNGLGENPMILVQNRRVALSDLAKITGTYGTLKYKSSVFALENLDNELQFTENENKQGTVTLYVKEDPTVEKSFTVKMYKASRAEIYADGKDLTSGVLRRDLPLQLATRFIDGGVTFFNDTNTFRKEVTWSVENVHGNTKVVDAIDQNGQFRVDNASEYNITGILTYKLANGREVYRESLFKRITVSNDELKRPRFISLDPENIEITAGTSKEIGYKITSHKGTDITDGQQDTITVKPKNAEDNRLVDITVMLGDNKIRITPKVTDKNKTVTLGIYDADDRLVRNFDVKIKGVQRHGLILKEGVKTPLVLFKDNTIDYNDLVTVTNRYGNEKENLVVTSQDFKLGGASTSYYIIGDETKRGTITVSLPGDDSMSLDIDVQQYKRPEVTINEGNQTIFRDEKKRFTVTYHIDSDNIDVRTRDEFRYEIEWSVRKEFNKPIIGTINQNTGEFIPQAEGECTVEATVTHFKLNNVIYTQTITRKVTVKASDNANYVLRATQPVKKVEINQFNITDTIGVSADVILTSTRNGNYEIPSVEVITNNGAPKSAINYYLTRVEGTNNCKLTIASATHSTTNGQNLKGATGIVKLTLGKGSRNEQNVEIPFVKNYDTPLNGIYADDKTVVIRNTDKDKSATISGTIRYSDKVNNVVQRDANGVVRPVSNLYTINTTLNEWNERNPNDNKWNDWQIGKISSGDRFSIPVSVMYPNESTGYESNMRIYSEVDPNWSADVHLVYWSENGDNSLIEPTVSPSPVPTGDTSASTPKP